MNKLSIITINYNDLVGLKRTVESVLNQTWKEFEYIVIDGGSTDGSVAYIESQSKSIDYWISEPDKGIYNAMNKGIAKATGEYLLFLNSGDHFFSIDVLNRNYKSLQSYDIIYFDLQVIDKKEIIIKKYPEQLFFSYFIYDTLPHPASFIKKALFDTIGLYDEELKIAADWKFFIQSICKFNFSYIKINDVLSTFYSDGLSSQPNNIDIIFSEKQRVIKSDFKMYLKDINQVVELERTISSLRDSKKIKLLIKFGLLNKF